MKFYAHSREGQDKALWEPLADHLRRTALLGARFARAFGLDDLGHAIGLLHDIGKYAAAFQRRIEGAAISVDHATPGAWAARRVFGAEVGVLLAYGIAGHHAGLPDGGDGAGDLLDRLRRLDKRLPDGFEAWEKADLPLLTKTAARLAFRGFADDRRLGDDLYRRAFLIRMLFSCLVDADFLATEHFYDKGKARRRRRDPSAGQMACLSEALARHMAGMGRGAASPLIAGWRTRILAACREGAPSKPGVFTLDVPTGGGKTLASLAFALDHAAAHGLDRVIYAIPYTSIIEQTADVFRKALREAGDDVVLEHHSAAEVPPSREEEGIGPSRLRLATENWDAPVVVTTTVQLFDSLHADRPSRCRKLHNLARSVIVLDEAQALPIDRLAPCLAALKALVQDYGASLLLCSATLPGLDRTAGLKVRLPQAAPLIPAAMTGDMAAAFRRVTVRDRGAIDDETLVAEMMAAHQVLTIVDSRAHARDLFNGLTADGANFHLSAAMCPAHRRAVLAEVKGRLTEGLPCRLVSTTVIEAGVDVSFPHVWRALAGIDSIAQAAGRCNRHGEGETLGDVAIFHPTRADAIPKPLADLRRRAGLGAEVLRHHADPLSPAAIDNYFERLFTLNEDQDRDRCWADMAKAPGLDCLPFRTVASRFSLIDDGGEPVIVPFDDEARGLIARLAAALASPVLPRRLPLDLLRRLQAFTVSVFSRQKLIEAGGAMVLDPRNDPEGRFVVLADGPAYDISVGFRPDLAGVRSSEGNVL
ncbi:CRISPR-associated helicase Cas3' [Zavarzinia aquatilis]|uniref:CRISPR-associated helicase/endonuclease Cas3 n=1 Tax=Zavarzinia aquatilis TaxID=2211142 RepID=A0A317EDL5_9PROT|nr:CRISPR-associated helicase Cas3' [Zavarzinia aquatilis]PWR24356.1 CRISPR-associated helicase/endonuclease Cas3 [Zavarzinia aquatilis]